MLLRLSPLLSPFLFSPSALLSFSFSPSPSSLPQMPNPRSQSPRGTGPLGGSGWSAAQAVARPPVLHAEQPQQAETKTACISEASVRALSPALSCTLSGSSTARLPSRTGFTMGGTRPSAWQISRDARVSPRCTQRPERSASWDPDAQQPQSRPLQGLELVRQAGRPGASWRAVVHRPGARQRPPGLPWIRPEKGRIS